MLAAFLESVKYVGHLFPLAIIRMYLGYSALHDGLERLSTDFLHRPQLASEIAEILPKLQLPFWYKSFIESTVIYHWQTFAFILMGIEVLIGISFLFGYVVRPVALLACIYFFNASVLVPANHRYFELVSLTCFIFAWLGAGRFIGFDYYFFKRRRGLWW